MESPSKIPVHVAIIMDGNGRWAQLHGKERLYGHMAGVQPIRDCIKAANRLGVRYLTFYAFSTENWGRPKEEVSALMDLFCKSVADETEELAKEGVRVRLIGRRDRFSPSVQSALEDIERRTKDGTKLDFILAFDYSSREEILHAARTLARKVASGSIKADDLEEKDITNALYTAGIPDPDLVIRTSGEQRLSNFLLWQASYAELYFPQTLWPDFGQKDFEEAIIEYSHRHRRYGTLDEE